MDPIITPQFIGLGLLLSLFFSEALGLAAGGMVVPGYMALMIHHPSRIAGTLLAALATFGLIRLLSNFMLIYGRRRTVLTILIGFISGWATRQLFQAPITELQMDFQAVGYIIPGLIAIWMERQGVNKTVCTMIMTAVLVKMMMIIFYGGDLSL
ncbi:MAG: poly-gamma-glutamate biosynthesis protein PgsC [Candidatus Cloacimonetes bacterium 4572_55]|nr:MAG: poly-gamma-glutamate biosynthesis protein PgsC [Candidatus Cloacimonetes bacterium 4572_55]